MTVGLLHFDWLVTVTRTFHVIVHGPISGLLTNRKCWARNEKACNDANDR